MSKLFIANWKMQLLPTAAQKLAQAFSKISSYPNKQIVICPDFVSLALISKDFKSSHIALGAQDVAAFDQGAYTGEVGVRSLFSLKVKYVLVGHSERRSYLQESDKLISAKLKMAISQGIKPILCVGENAAERRQGRANVVIRRQLKGALSLLTLKEIKSIIVAYEPIWAIGKGVHCNIEQAMTIKSLISDYCFKMGIKRMKVLYGGSVNPDNASLFLKGKAFDGLLVGGASLDAHSFEKIVKA
jgi:triosephosphate isomerase (TIM)